MTDLDTRLRSLAHESLARVVADVPVDDDLADVRRRLATRPLPTPEPDRSWPWQRLSVAAAIALLVGGAVALLATRGSDDEPDLVAPASAPETTVVPTPVLSTPDSVAPETTAADTTIADPTTTTELTTTTVVASPGTLGSGYFERVPLLDEEPYFEIRQLGTDGSSSVLAAAETEQLLRREIALDGGRSIWLLPEEEQPYGRCDSRPVGTSGPTQAATPDANSIGRVRSLAASPGGVVVVGVDVCPDGTAWGDDGTWFELRRIDLGTGTTTVLHVREPGEGDTFFEAQDVVYAGGEFLAESVSPDGAYVAVAEPYTTEDTRYHVFDAVDGGDPIEFASACDDPRDLVGPPRFVGDGLVVLARECSPVDGEVGGLIVELVSLDTRQPVWSVEVDQVAIDSYSRTVSLSARSVDGQVWALVSGSAGVEQPIRAAAVTAGVEQPLPGEAIVAFDPRELIYPWDPYSI